MVGNLTLKLFPVPRRAMARLYIASPASPAPYPPTRLIQQSLLIYHGLPIIVNADQK